MVPEQVVTLGVDLDLGVERERSRTIRILIRMKETLTLTLDRVRGKVKSSADLKEEGGYGRQRVRLNPSFDPFGSEKRIWFG